MCFPDLLPKIPSKITDDRNHPWGRLKRPTTLFLPLLQNYINTNRREMKAKEALKKGKFNSLRFSLWPYYLIFISGPFHRERNQCTKDSEGTRLDDFEAPASCVCLRGKVSTEPDKSGM